MKRSVLLRGAAALVAASACATVGLAVAGPGKPAETTVVGLFADASPLDPGSEIRAAGVKVGNVRDIALDHGQARVTFTIDPSVLPLHRDAKMVIRPVNLLGEHYVDLDAGTPSQPYLGSAVVPVQQTSSSVELQDVLNTLDDPTSTALASLITTLGEGMQDSGAEAADAIKALAPAMNNTKELGDLLGQQNTVLTQLLDRVQPVAGALASGDGAALGNLVDSTERTLSTVAANQQALDQTLVQLPATVTSARQTLAELAGVADTTTPVLASVRPVTDNLAQISTELQQLADAADPALASLQPVLQRADALLDQAAPVVAQLRASGPGLAATAKSLHPLGDQLLDSHLGDLMDFVRKWSLSTNGRDALSHYFRGVVHVTPDTLKDLVTAVPGVAGPSAPGPSQASPGLPQPLLPTLGLPGTANSDPGSATGLTQQQEQGLLGQLLGGL